MLAVTAPPGPPASGTEFLDRLDTGWLESAYAGDWPRLSAVRAPRRSGSVSAGCDEDGRSMGGPQPVLVHDATVVVEEACGPAGLSPDCGLSRS